MHFWTLFGTSRCFCALFGASSLRLEAPKSAQERRTRINSASTLHRPAFCGLGQDCPCQRALCCFIRRCTFGAVRALHDSEQLHARQTFRPRLATWPEPSLRRLRFQHCRRCDSEPWAAPEGEQPRVNSPSSA
eukprot:7788238-Alexandrium_andersonii.AAC.1